MAMPPLSARDRNELLQIEINKIEKQIDEVIAESLQKQDLQTEFHVELDPNPRATAEQVQRAIIDKYLNAGWDKVYFTLDDFRNETTYLVNLEQV